MASTSGGHSACKGGMERPCQQRHGSPIKAAAALEGLQTQWGEVSRTSYQLICMTTHSCQRVRVLIFSLCWMGMRHSHISPFSVAMQMSKSEGQ